MKSINKRLHKTSRYGATTLFLAIVLSALVLIQCVYIAIVTDNDVRLAYNRGVKLQVETILADYDRALFRNYGIYAFDSSMIEPSVFYNVLYDSGIEYGNDISIECSNSFDTEQLRIAISTFYSYRISGILFNEFAGRVSDALATLDEHQVLEGLGEFVSSRAAGYLGSIIEGGEAVTDAISAVTGFLRLAGLSERIDHFSSFLASIRSLISSDPDYTNGFEIDNLNGLTGIVDSLYTFNESASNIVSDVAFRPFVSHYSAYNFDSYLDDDSTINGVTFESLHGENYADAEYILTGLEGDSGVSATKMMIFPAVLILAYVNILNDDDTMAVINGISEVLSAVIAVLTAGSVTVPMEAYKAVIIVIYGLINAVSDMEDVMDGEELDIISVDDLPLLSLGYRDFIYIFLHFVDDETQLQRISEILCRDYEGYCSTVTASTQYRNFLISTTNTYSLYQ